MDAMLLLKVTLLLSVTLLAARLLGRAAAATRHRLWTLAFAAVLSLPVLTSALPPLHVPMPDRWRPVGAAGDWIGSGPGDRSPALHLALPDRGVTNRILAQAGVPEPPRSTTPDRSSWSVPFLLLATWLTGTFVAAATLLLSLLRARRLARTAKSLVDPAWRHSADALGARLGLRRAPRLVVSAGVGTPMAGGVWRPTIFLPVSAHGWSPERRDIVLAHEIAHLAGLDPLRHVLARLAIATYWFHPLAWIAARHAIVAREQACDEIVLGLGTRPSVYARVLLDLADAMPQPAPALGAMPMVERSLLEARLMSILNADVRAAATRRGLTSSITIVLLTLSVAAAQPAVSTASADESPAVGLIAAVVPAPAGPSAFARPAKLHVETTSDLPTTTQPDTSRDTCWGNLFDGASFSGTMSTSDAGGRSVILEQVGTRGRDRVIQKRFGDLQLCMVAEEAGDRDSAERPSEWPGRARRVILEARRGGATERLTIGRWADGGQRISWQVGSAERSFDTTAQQWRDSMLAVLDTTWELAMLRGEVSSLRGQISSIHGQRSSLQGEISSLRGEVSSIRGRISSLRGHESSLRGQISSIQGHVSSLRGAISSEQGAISSLNASRYRADETERARIALNIRRHDAEIARIEKAIRDYGADAKIAAVEQEINTLGTEKQVAAIEAKIRAFDLDGKVAAVERRIAALDVDAKVAAIERQIDALDAERRGRQLEDRRESELKKLEAAIAAIR
jgi:beta-lactamase regulating signal transducer with metallopeptidase domain